MENISSGCIMEELKYSIIVCMTIIVASVTIALILARERK